MSEYTPITGELRTAMVEFNGEPAMRLDVFNRCVDAIDAIHAQLERENESLKAVHAQLERENDELRMKFVNVNRYAEHVERENEALKAELDRVLGEQEGATMPLPLDMDGKPIHFGDVMQRCNDPELREVEGFYGGGFLAWLNGRFVPCAAKLYRHHVPDTWERIIEDAIGEGMARQRNNDSGNFCERANPMNNGDLVARCKALCERTREAGE